MSTIYNKVIMNNNVLIDLSSDTVTPNNLLSGITAHNNHGTLITGTYQPTLQTKSVNPTESSQQVTADSGYDGLSSVTINAIPNTYVIPTGTKTITENGTGIDVASYAEVDVSVSGGSSGVNLPTFTITWDDTYENITNVTCDKTYSECVSIFNNGDITALSSDGYPFLCLGSSHDTTSNLDFLSYLVSFENGPFYDLKYWSNGNITTTSPSIYSETLTATQNGETYYPTNGVFTEVNVDTTLWAYVEYDSNEEKWILDKTYSEIAAAYAAHKDIIVYGNPQSDITTHSDYDGSTLYYIVRAYDIVNNALTQWNYSLTSSGLTEISNTTYVLPPTLQTKSVSPTESIQVITPDNGYDGLNSVSVGAISNSYIGSGITQRNSSDLSASGATVTAPAGYYATSASQTIASGSATAPASISGTSATVSTGTNTLTLTKSVSVTPSVTAGYISSGTAGNSSVSLTANVTTKAADTITPGTTNQTIASGTYLTGTQTIVGDADLIASNIISTANIFGVQGSVVINKYYTGSSAPNSSLGNNGDIYLQS